LGDKPVFRKRPLDGRKWTNTVAIPFGERERIEKLGGSMLETAFLLSTYKIGVFLRPLI
jgi:hypothetical protein